MSDISLGVFVRRVMEPMRTVFNRLNLEKLESYDKAPATHLKPLSVYSRMITCEGDKTGLHLYSSFSNTFCNLKVEVVNNTCSVKRRLDDSCLDDTYEPPAKQPFTPNTVSPDLGWIRDSFSPLPKLDLLDGPKAIRCQNDDTVAIVKSHQDSKHVEISPSKEPGSSEEGTAPNSVGSGSKRSESSSERVILNHGPVFDFNVENILCLSPINCYMGKREGIANLEICKCPRSNWLQNEPVIVQSPTGQGMGERGGQKERKVDELKKGGGNVVDNSVTDQEEDDGGYFSRSYLQALKLVRSPCQPGSPLVPQATSSPLVRTDKRDMLEGEGDAPCPPEPINDQTLYPQHSSPTVADCYTLNRPPLCPVKGVLEGLEGDVGEVWSIGAPLLESTMCHSATVKPTEGSEKVALEGGEVEGSVLHSIEECQSTLHGEEFTSETSLPLQVQVKSVVVVPNLKASSSTSALPCQPEHKVLKQRLPESLSSKSTKSDRTIKSQRPVVFDREEDWQREKQLYMHAVTRHMTENPGAGQDLMTELQNLMTTVAEQDTNGRQWQHPSDLTRRNYQRRLGNMTTSISLNEWQTQNCRSHKRFAKIPKVFERSPIP